MSILLCQANGDLAIVNNQLWLTSNDISPVPAVAAFAPLIGQETLQLIRNILRMGQGEEPLDLALGMPYFQTILKKGTTLDTVQAIIYDAVLNVPGVLSVINYKQSFNASTRQLTVTFTAQTDDGPIQVEETFP